MLENKKEQLEELNETKKEIVKTLFYYNSQLLDIAGVIDEERSNWLIVICHSLANELKQVNDKIKAIEWIYRKDFNFYKD